MLQVGGGPDLGQEPLGAEHGGELGLQHLERDLAVVPEVVGEIDGRHAALAELALDLVLVGQGGVQSFEEFGHSAGGLQTRSQYRSLPVRRPVPATTPVTLG